MTDPHPPRIRLRLDFGPGAVLGPGKADLLEAIRDTGSISAAGRRMGMSYKRAWQLVETMNAMFESPLVDSARGGLQGGGAHLTDAGAEVLAHFRALEAVVRDDGRAHIEALSRLVRDMSERK